MLKCIHQTSPTEVPATNFVTDFYVNYLLFGPDGATLANLYGETLYKFKYKNGIQAGVFAENKAIIAKDTKKLYFYDIKNKTNKIVKCKKPIHALLPGQDFNSFYIGTYKGKDFEIELMSLERNDVIFKLKGRGGILSGLKRFFAGEVKPLEISISHSGPQIYICDKSPKVEIFSESKLAKSLDNFPVPIYQALYRPDNSLLLFGALDRTVYAFDENRNQIFSKEFAFSVKDVLLADTRLVIIGEFGAIFILNVEGEIIDGGFIGKDIIDCHISPEGLLWCLAENASLMIIAQTKLSCKTVTNIFSWIHIDKAEKKGPLQKVLYEINEKNKKQRSRELKLQSKARRLNKKEKELEDLDEKLKQDSKGLNSAVSEIDIREKRIDAKLKRSEKLKATILRMDTVEVWSLRLKTLQKRTIEDKTNFPVLEEKINKIVQEIKETEQIKSSLTEKVKQKTEELSRLREKIGNLSEEERGLKEESGQTKKRLSELESLIEQKNTFLKNAPQQIEALEKEEKSCNSRIKELEDKLSSFKQRIDKAKADEEESEKRLNVETEKLNQILLSAKVVKEKQKNIPEIYKLAQKLTKLIDETH